MSYIGKTPTSVPLTSSDITDSIISLPKLTDGTDGNLISYDASGNPVAVATGTDGQVLTSTGAGSPPVFEDAGGGTNTPLFRATVSGTQTVPNATNTKIDFNTEVYDPQSTYDTSNKRFTPAVAGYYFIGAKIRTAINNDFGYFSVKIYKNGSSISVINNSHWDTESVEVSIIDLADADDYYEIFTYHNKGTAENYSSDTNEMQFFGNKLIT